VTARLVVVALLVAAPCAASTPEVEVGAENFYYRTAQTLLNHGNTLALDPDEDLLRATLHWRQGVGDSVRLVLRGYVQRRLGARETTDWKARQAYVQWSGADRVTVRVGRQRVAWGSGLAWNPTNRVEPPKNPFNATLEQNGATAVRVDLSPASWAGLALVAARTDVGSPDLPIEGRARQRRTGAVRARFLVEDTDLALVYSGGQGQRTLVGLDLGRTFGAVAAHAEAAVYRGAEMPPARDDEHFWRLVAGVLWTRGEHLTVTAEYFFNGEGYADARRQAWLDGLRRTSALASDPRAPEAVREAAGAEYGALASVPFAGGLGLGRHYLHAGWSSRLGGGRWTASARAVLGLSDGGLALTPGLGWSPRGDLELQLDAVALLGPETSEFRLAPLRTAVQARVRLHF
jgi:hypothetical protein